MLIHKRSSALALRLESPHIRTEIKRIAAAETWKLAALPNSARARLEEAIGITSRYWFNTNGAAMYCLCQSGDQETDWYNVLKENRRQQVDILAAISSGKKPRGNVYRLGKLDSYNVAKKVYYTKEDLDKWLAGISPSSTH